MKVSIFIDGACKGNPGPMGAGIILISEAGHYRELSVPLGQGTNNRAELLALKTALEQLKIPGSEVTVYTDSQLVVGIFSQGWKPKANLDIIGAIKPLLDKHLVSFVHVKGHSGIEMNEKVDSLAKKACFKWRM